MFSKIITSVKNDTQMYKILQQSNNTENFKHIAAITFEYSYLTGNILVGKIVMCESS